MVGKKRFTSIREGCRRTIASKLATAKRRQAAAHGFWVKICSRRSWSEIH
jgi:hypothetical protein